MERIRITPDLCIYCSESKIGCAKSFCTYFQSKYKRNLQGLFGCTSKITTTILYPMYPIGPFHEYFLGGSTSTSLLTSDRSCISWIDRQEHNCVVYVSFGRIVAISEDEFLEVAWGLANSKQPFLWVIRPGMIRSSQWLEPLPCGFQKDLGGGYTIKWAP